MQNTAISLQTGFSHLTDLPCIKLQRGKASAIVSLYGAQVLSYQPAPQQELLWLSPLATWHNATPIRGGIPICWPWFGPASPVFTSKTDNPLPNHGLVRTRLWQLAAQHVTEDSVGVTLSITVDDIPATKPVNLQLTVTLTDSLGVTLQCDNGVLQQAALHSYFAISDITNTTVAGLGNRYQDKLRNTLQEHAKPLLSITEETDRIYLQPDNQLRITDKDFAVHIDQHGADATIAWNPWMDKSSSTADLPDDSYTRFICVETARLQLNEPAPLLLKQTIRRC